MANFLSPTLGAANAVKVGGSQALLSGRPNPTRAGLAAGMSIVGGGGVRDAIGAASPALGALGLGGLLGGVLGGLAGSKPRALHTEYATTSANWQKPYGSGTDIVFYLMRADGGGGAGSAAAGTVNPTASSGWVDAPPGYSAVSSEGAALAQSSNGYFKAGQAGGPSFISGTDWTPISQ